MLKRGCGSLVRRRASITLVSAENPPYMHAGGGVVLTSYPPGYLQGAYFEGMDIALAVAKCIDRGGCHGLEHVEKVRNAQPYN